MADPQTRSAAKFATLVALPLAIIAGLIVFFALRPSKPNNPTVTASPQATTPVTMSAPKLSDADAVICRAFAAGLPSKIRELAQRPVTAGSEQNAAYGDPPITVACGAPAAKVDVTAEVYTMNTVCWYASTNGKDTTWTTLDRQVPVAVTVPPSYSQPAQWANEFSNEVVASIKSVKSPYC